MGQVTKIEHFYLTSPKAEALYNLFHSELGLPVVWRYQSWGSFESGGLSLANVVLEFVSQSGGATTFSGIALEPQQHMEDFLVMVDDARIKHGKIQNTVFLNKDGQLDGWSTLSLKGLLPEEANLFVCDYKRRQEVAENRATAASELENKKGGALGIMGLREIVVASPNYATYIQSFSSLRGVKKAESNLFRFEQGPAIRIIQSDKNQIQGIVIQVSSVQKAESALQSRGLDERSSTQELFINRKKIEGLQVQLVEGH